MKWLEMIDERAGDFVYVSRHMAVRTYLIIRDLEKLANGWEDDDQYQEFTDLAKTCVGRLVVETEQEEEDELNEHGTFRAASDSYTYEDIKKEVKLF
jgi:hypothetical protein